MTSSEPGITHKPALSFLATLSFVTSFLIARTFTTIYPDRVVIQGGIHFHHFWYGLAMIAVAGWLAIAWRSSNTLNRIYAIVYGLGAGLIGDEIGLLLTLGDYHSELTFQFFIAAISFVILAILLIRYGDDLVKDILHNRTGERLSHIGIFIAGVSSILFAFDFLLPGLAAALFGGALIVVGVVYRYRR